MLRSEPRPPRLDQLNWVRCPISLVPPVRGRDVGELWQPFVQLWPLLISFLREPLAREKGQGLTWKNS